MYKCRCRLPKFVLPTVLSIAICVAAAFELFYMNLYFTQLICLFISNKGNYWSAAACYEKMIKDGPDNIINHVVKWPCVYINESATGKEDMTSCYCCVMLFPHRGCWTV